MKIHRIAPLLVLAAVAGCGQPRDVQTPRVGQPSRAPVDSVASQPAPSATALAPPASVRPSSYGQLSRFVAQARAVDARLRTAADAINHSGPPWGTVSARVSSAVVAADPADAAKAIPAGLPAPLLRKVLLIYSDLASRRDAMEDFARPGPLQTGFTGTTASQAELRNLSNGAPAAHDFAGDLRALVALAQHTAPVRLAASTSRAAAELQLLIGQVNAANGGCDSHGGQRLTVVPAVRWNSSGTGGVLHFADGGEEQFTATRDHGRWQTEILVC